MEGLWPILILWALAAIFGGKKKRPSQQPLPGADDAEARGGLGRELSQALEQLKRAEEEAQRRRQQVESPAPTSTSGARRDTREVRAQQYLEERKRKGGARVKPGQRLEVYTPKTSGPSRTPARRPVRPLEDESDMSSEVEPIVISVENQADYDEEAEAIVAARRQAAERLGVSREGLSDAQQARRAARVDAPIGGRKQHAAWHERVDTKPAAAPGPKAGPLARFADGSARSAVILAEIFSRPLAERD